MGGSIIIMVHQHNLHDRAKARTHTRINMHEHKHTRTHNPIRVHKPASRTCSAALTSNTRVEFAGMRPPPTSRLPYLRRGTREDIKRLLLPLLLPLLLFTSGLLLPLLLLLLLPTTTTQSAPMTDAAAAHLLLL